MDTLVKGTRFLRCARPNGQFEYVLQLGTEGVAGPVWTNAGVLLRSTDVVGCRTIVEFDAEATRRYKQYREYREKWLQETSPKEATASPKEATASPKKATASPKKATASPKKATASPKEATDSPTDVFVDTHSHSVTFGEAKS
jgi:hypothetical protein